MKAFSLYIHIPFCKSKCHYCDFTSFLCNNETMSKYIKNLMVELSIYKERLKEYRISTIFIGGGTPSTIDAKYIEEILNYIYDNYNTDLLEEISIEINPGTIDEYKVKKYKKLGINRISLGVQSINDKILKSIGRSHNVQDVYSSIDILKNQGFNNINADLIFSLPGQTIEDIEYSLREIIRLELEHISLYSLIIEDDTPLGRLYNRGLVEYIDEDLDREIYHKSIEILKNAGYEHYEVSNFAKNNKKCLHNLAYWRIQPYLGVGLSSHSNLFSERFYNYSDMSKYNESLSTGNLPLEGRELIDKETEIGEYMIMGLRLIQGVNIREYQERFSEDIYSRYGQVISKHKANELLRDSDGHLSLTKKGLDLANLVEVDFFNIS